MTDPTTTQGGDLDKKVSMENFELLRVLGQGGAFVDILYYLA